MNKNKLMIHGNPFVSDLPPVIKEGRTLIPVGAVVKGLGAEEVKWNDETKTVTILKGGKEIVLVIGENIITIDGKAIQMDTEAQILGNRTYVPLRFIVIGLGEEVEWNPEDGTINVGRALGQERAAEARAKNEKENEVEVLEDEDDED